MTDKKSRFPENVIAYVQAQIAHDETPKGDALEQARASGDHYARFWILTMFGLTGLLRQRQLGELDPGIKLDWSVRRPTKRSFSRLLAQAATACEQLYGFNAGNGWNQVADQDAQVNRVFGFWDQINTIVDEFALWEGVDEPESALHVAVVESQDAGGCNFCPGRDPEVVEIKGLLGLKIRMCRGCLRSLGSQTKAWAQR